ncbi:MAG: 3-deoxy-D-manno-octulosonic acid transferase [Desulfobacterales bacterium]|nr:3-deoxy-D-manno-octulosonic acid transferase [Desulfobacterales bacterium]MDD4071970.1 3-deoxy-D-manno-octulosonic acid transferase [Desulfobacterales bacterium]MDD4391726.1 3-deoxy-D-manno-octulosonic acid transferase [Desulfobacterales bacterium]
MNIAYPIYKYITSGLFLAGFPFFWGYVRQTGRREDEIRQRLGYYPPGLPSRRAGTPNLWIHAVSVGEVKAAVPIIEALETMMPDAAFVLSTTTSRGQVLAREVFPANVSIVYAPVDYIGAVRRAFSAIAPDALVILETEIWPNLLVEAHRRGIQTAIVNGRVSARTIKNYLKIKPLVKETLECVDAFSMISAADAERVKRIGARRQKITVGGNSKFDFHPGECDASVTVRMRRLYNVTGDQPVIVAGSTRRSEERIVLDAFAKICQFFPDTLCIIAPRHIERVNLIADMVKDHGISYQFSSDLDGNGAMRNAPVVIIDTIGELQNTYSIAAITFCGGSLVPLGGQNVLEPARWAKPVLYGPSMEDFLDAKNLLEKSGGGIPVADGNELTEKLLFYLSHPEKAAHAGQMARRAVMQNRGASQRHARVIYELLNR